MSSRFPGPIPNRWLNCPRKSETIIAERFLAFKTPLSNAYKDQMPLECIFPPEMIFDYCKVLKIKLGLWIDLTNTKRFYDREVVESRGAKYVKLQCRGHGETPSPEQTQAFIEIVNDFITENPLDIIAVHCTHGFNRTGFLIVSYLVEQLDCSVEAAFDIFSKARPPGIYKQDYIDELFRRYGDVDDAILAPELPEWCFDYDDSNSVGREEKRPQKRSYVEISSIASTSQQAKNAKQNAYFNSAESVSNGDEIDEDDEIDCTDDNGGSTSGNSSVNGNAKKSKRRRRELVIKDPTFMEGVPGVALVTDKKVVWDLQRKVQDMCNWDKSGFPGAQPVSMDRENLKRLAEIPYRVSWKADGTRYMMLIDQRDKIYFFDRNFSCFQVENITFLKAGNSEEHLTNTLLDGEMVLDKFQEQITPRYLIYDVITLCNNEIGKKEFPERLQCIKKEIIEPRIAAFEKGIIDRSMEPFGVRNKEFWDIRTSASLLGEKFAKSLLHEPDGLIFQPKIAPYTTGVCPDVLKWKPINMNSVDFRLQIAKESGNGIVTRTIGLLFVGGLDTHFGTIKYTKALKELHNKIIECTVDNQGHWQFLRERTDKTLPNSFNTAKSVLESIRHPVTTEYLLYFIQKYGFREDREKMPPPQEHRVPHHQTQSQQLTEQQQQHRQQQNRHMQQQLHQHQYQQHPQHKQYPQPLKHPQHQQHQHQEQLPQQQQQQ